MRNAERGAKRPLSIVAASRARPTLARGAARSYSQSVAASPTRDAWPCGQVASPASGAGSRGADNALAGVAWGAGGREHRETRAGDAVGREAHEAVLGGDAHQLAAMLHAQFAMEFPAHGRHGGRAESE